MTNSVNIISESGKFAAPTSEAKTRVVLVDDDPIYQNLFAAVARSMGLSVKTYGSLAEMISFAHLNHYDFAVIDYHLESFTGAEIAEYVDIFFPELPVFLISADDDIGDMQGLPLSIKKFFCKTSNPRRILDDALTTIDQLKFYETLRQR